MWMPVKGYEGYYDVSDDGRVRSLDRFVVKSNGIVQRRAGKVMSQTEDKDGYMIVGLSKDGDTKKVPVHRIVYSAFYGEIPSGMEIDHKDFNRKNNRIGNLCALTHSGNVQKTVNAKRNFTATNDTRGINNPNFGNRKLGRLYSEDPELAKQKQSRPGACNGMAKPIRIAISNGQCFDFPYIRDCAQYLVKSGMLTVGVDHAALMLTRAAKSGSQYKGIRVEFI